MWGTRDFENDGIAVIDAVVTKTTVLQVQDLPEFLHGDRPGRRSFSVPPLVAELAAPQGALTEVATCLMRERVRAVRVLYFDKTPGMNWAVPWHQDRTIAVARRIDVPGFAVWSLKGGVHHVEPPVFKAWSRCAFISMTVGPTTGP